VETKCVVFYVYLNVYPCTILQINPTRCTILLSIFISLLYMFRATVCQSSGEITVSMRYWYLSLGMGGKYQYRIDTEISPDDGHTVCLNMQRSEINILSRIVHLIGFICKKKNKIKNMCTSSEGEMCSVVW